MRSQTITLNVRQNATLGVSARQAALTGLAAGLREMHSPDWSGTNTTLTRTLSPHEAFQVAFVAGDDTLTAADADYAEFPYRVTLMVTGTASDPTDANRISQHTIRAVARLIPRAVPNEPSEWATMQTYTFYQTKECITTLDIPCSHRRPYLRLQGKLHLGHHYPMDDDAWSYYFYHLNLMRWNGYGDYRTLTGRVDFDYWQQDWHVRDILTNYMSVSTSHVALDTANADWSKPTCLTAYRLFPGGPQYSIPSLSGTLANRTLDISVSDNPLGLYYAGGSLVLGDNVTIRGTLFCQEELRVDGTNVVFESVDNPPLHGAVSADTASLLSPAVKLHGPSRRILHGEWSVGRFRRCGRRTGCVAGDPHDQRPCHRGRSRHSTKTPTGTTSTGTPITSLYYHNRPAQWVLFPGLDVVNRLPLPSDGPHQDRRRRFLPLVPHRPVAFRPPRRRFQPDGRLRNSRTPMGAHRNRLSLRQSQLKSQARCHAR